MKMTLIAALIAIAGSLAVAAPVHAATDAQKEQWQKMTPEEKAAAKAKAKAKYDAMSPEEQAAAKAKAKAKAMPKYEAMSPEEQAAAKAKAKAKYDAMSPEEQAAAKKKFDERHPQAAKKAEDKKAEAAPTK